MNNLQHENFHSSIKFDHCSIQYSLYVFPQIIIRNLFSYYSTMTRNSQVGFRELFCIFCSTCAFYAFFLLNIGKCKLLSIFPFVKIACDFNDGSLILIVVFSVLSLNFWNFNGFEAFKFAYLLPWRALEHVFETLRHSLAKLKYFSTLKNFQNWMQSRKFKIKPKTPKNLLPYWWHHTS